MEYPKEFLFSEDHEWLAKESDLVRIGITVYAQSELGDVVYANLPEVGTVVKKGDSMVTVESVKAVSDVYAPIDGKVSAINEALNDSPQLINEDPHGKGWMVVLIPTSPDQLNDMLTAEKYEALL